VNILIGDLFRREIAWLQFQIATKFARFCVIQQNVFNIFKAWRVLEKRHINNALYSILRKVSTI
jgi:hypothetical protein